MAGFVHDGAAAEGVQLVVHHLRTFDLADEGGSGLAREDFAAIDEHQHVAKDHLAFLIDGADAVRVTIEGHAEVRTVGLYRRDEVFEIFGQGRVGMVVWKAAVHVEEQFGDVAVELLKQTVQDGACGAVACVQNHLDAALELKVGRDFVDVGRDAVEVGDRAAGIVVKVAGFDHLAEKLDLVAVDGALPANGFEAVVFRRVVGPRDHDAAVGGKLDAGIIEDRRRDAADVVDLATAFDQTGDQSVAKTVGGEANIAADVHLVAASGLTLNVGAEGLAEESDAVARKVDIGDAANVVFAEDRRVQTHLPGTVAFFGNFPAGNPQWKDVRARRVATEQQLVERMASGDEAAFEAIYHDHQRGIFRFSLHMSGDHGIAEEITQEAFVALIERPAGFDGARGSLAAYLYGVARNLLRKRMRQDWSVEPLPEGDLGVLAAEEEDPTDSFALEAVRAAVVSLPPVYREAVALCDLQEASYEEAAAILDCAIGTVRSRLFRGRKMLALKLKGAVRV